MVNKSFIFAFGLIIIGLVVHFVLAAHVITTSSGGTGFSVNEDVQFTYNISVNNTDSADTANITQVNITLPTSLTFADGTNRTDAGAHSFTNASISWFNASNLVGNLTRKFFGFNASASTPGTYNITMTTVNVSGVFQTNITLTVNDTTAPSSITFVSPTSTNGSILVSNIPLNITATDNVNISTIVVRLYNSTRNQINSSSSSTSPLNITFLGLSTGTYYVNATANARAGNSN